MIKRLTKREQKIFIVCVAVVAIYGGYHGVLKPVVHSAEAIEKRVEAKEREKIKDLKVIQRGKAIEGEYQAYFERFGQTRTNEQVKSAMVADIEEVARSLQLQISDLKPKREKKGEFYNRFSISLTIDSSLNEITQFFHAIQSAPHYFDVDEVSFDKASRRPSSQIKTNLVLSKVFLLP